MANSDDISIIIGVQSQSVDKAGKKLEGMRRTVVSLNKMVNKGTISNAQYEKGLKELARSNDVVLGSRQKSTAVIRRMAKETEAMVSADKRAGIAVKKVGKEVDALASKMDRASTSAKRLSKNMALTGKRTSRLGANMQQVGYQVGDFAVQIQGGTNAAVALGQQGAQLLGIFGPVGALAGAGLAIGTALVAPLMRGKEEAKSLVDVIKGLKKELDDLNGVGIPDELKATFTLVGDIDEDILKKEQSLLDAIALQQDNLLDTSGSITKEIKDEDIADVQRLTDELEKLSLARDKASKPIKEYQQAQLDLINKQSDEQTRLMENEIKLSVIRAKGSVAQEEYRAEEIRQNLESFELDLKRDRFNKLEIAKLLDKRRIVLETANETKDALAAQIEARKIEESRLKLQGEAFRKRRKENQDNREQQNKVNKAAKEQLRLQNQAIRLQAYEKKFGKDSLEYKREAGAIERENLVLKMETAGVDQEIIDKMVAGNMRLEIGRELLAKQVQEAKELKEQLDRIAKMDFPNLSIAEGAYASQLALYGSQTGPSGPPPPPRTGTKKKTPQEQLAEEVKGLTESAKKEQELVGLFGTERDVRSEIIGLQDQYGEKLVSTHETEIRNAIELQAVSEARQQTLQDAIDQQKALAETIDASMGDAFMSIIDGTMSVKDAFKQMAADIIKELMRVYVVQQMVNAAKMFFGLPFADGGAFSGGSQIQAYADGGVVGGPTTFPMAGGKTGLMGEAGPEAIMPLKRGANGKLGVQMEGGGGQSVVINQSFNFQANGDDSVKKIIAQAAPQIANLTKKSMLDDRRRGGQMKATFG